MGEWQRIYSRADYKEFLRADLVAHNLNRWAVYRRWTHPELHYQRVLRRVEYLQTRRGIAGRLSYVGARFRLARLSIMTGLSIPPGVCDMGLSIAHLGSIVVNDQARIGKFCRLHSATNIGVSGGGAPRIGDFVYVGPGAVLYGAIEITDRTVVGANAVVGSDVKVAATVAGAPARSVSSATSERVMPEWFPATWGV